MNKIALLLVTLFVTACAHVEKAPYYEWVKIYAPAKKVTWWQGTREQVSKACDRVYLSSVPWYACAKLHFDKERTCDVYATVSEIDSHRVFDADGLTAYQHEVEKHCAGWVHLNVD